MPPFIEQKIAAEHKLIEGRVVGGLPASSGQYPYQLIFQVRPGRRNQDSAAQFCGASLIRENVAVTAAHCATKYAYSPQMYLLLGGVIIIYDRDNNPNYGPNRGPNHGPNYGPNHGSGHRPNHGRYYVGSDPNAQAVGISRIKIHEDYNINTKANDICLLFLAQNLTYTPYVQNISLPSPNAALPIGENLTVTGFGVRNQRRNYYSDSDSEYLRLRGANVTVYETCDQNITAGSFCAGAPEGGRGVCQGDGGDPLADVNTNILMGIASKRLNCGQPNAPAIYTNVAYYLDWITRNLNAA